MLSRFVVSLACLALFCPAICTSDETIPGVSINVYAPDQSILTSTASSLEIVGQTEMGTISYPTGGMVTLNIKAPDYAWGIQVAAMDEKTNYIYAASGEAPPRYINKITKDDGTGSARLVASLKLDDGIWYDNFHDAVVDSNAGYGYFTKEGITNLLKISLGEDEAAPRLIGSIQFQSFSSNSGIELDASRKLLYVASGISIYKISTGDGDTLPVVLSQYTLPGGFACGIIDDNGEYGYYSTLDKKLVKLKLGGSDGVITPVATINLESTISTMAIIPGGGGRIFGVISIGSIYGSKLAKIKLGTGDEPPVLESTRHMESNYYYPNRPTFDVVNNMCYLLGGGMVVKVGLGHGAQAPFLISETWIFGDYGRFSSIFFDNETELIHALTDGDHGRDRGTAAYYTIRDKPQKVPRMNPVSFALPEDFDQVGCVVYSPEIDIALLGTRTSPAQIIKMKVGDDLTTPTIIGSITLPDGLNDLRCGVFEVGGSIAYFGTNTSPGQVMRVSAGGDAGPPELLQVLELEPGDDYLRCAAYDAEHGMAFWGTYTSPGRVIGVKYTFHPISYNPMLSRALAFNLDPGVNYLRAVAYDNARSVGYFATHTKPTRISAVGIAPVTNVFEKLGIIQLNDGEDYIESAFAGPDGFHGYFATGSVPSKIVKVSLSSGDSPSSFQRIDAIEMKPEDGRLLSGLFNEGYWGDGYWGTGSTPGRVVKTNLDNWTTNQSSHFARVESVDLDDGVTSLSFGFKAGDYLVFIAATSPGHVVKINLHSEIYDLTVNSISSLPPVTGDFGAAVINESTGQVHMGSKSEPGRIVSYTTSHPLRQTGRMRLEPGEGNLRAGLLDDQSGYAYFASNAPDGSTHSIVMVDTRAGGGHVTRVGAVPSVREIESGVIDSEAGYAYYGNSASPPVVAKYALSRDGELPVFAGAADMPQDFENLRASVIDTAAGYAWFGTYTTPGRIVKVALGADGAPPALVDSLILNNDENRIVTGAIDTITKHSYWLCESGRLVRVESGALQRVNAASMIWTVSPQATAAIDARDGRVYLGNLSHIVKYDITSLNHPPIPLGSVGTDHTFRGMSCGVIDSKGEFAYWGGEKSAVTKTLLGQKGAIKGIGISLKKAARVHDIRLLSFQDGGQYRLLLYDNKEPMNLVWESKLLTADKALDDVVALPSEGHPPELILPKGGYWLAWQLDSDVFGPSYTGLSTYGGKPGFVYPASFGPPPRTISLKNETESTDRLRTGGWTEYLRYTPWQVDVDGFRVR